MTLPFFRKNNKKKSPPKTKKSTMNEERCKADQHGGMGSVLDPDLKDCNVIGPTAVEGMTSCPCCNRQLKQGRQTVLGGDNRFQSLYESLFKDDGSGSGSDTESSSHSYSDMDEEDSMMPGVLSGGAPYTVTEDLAQGWMHKKGTGKDWIGSRAWKPRWALLSLARIPGHEVEVPILQIFWHPGAPTPSTVIHLDSAVVMPEDRKDKSEWNCFRFQVRHVRKSVDEHSLQITRSFSCPREGRDLWCQVINEALLKYEKEKARARRQSSYLSLSPPRWRSAAWITGDVHPSTAKDFSPVRTSPTASPGSSPPRNLPRPEPALIGESLLSLIMDE